MSSIQITSCNHNIMGTVSFNGKFPTMKKAEDFIVYPMQDSSFEICIQSEHRFGKICLETGKAVLSGRRAQYANQTWLMLCQIRGTALNFTVSQEETQTLRQWVKSTGGIEVGSSLVKSDNIGAFAL